MENKRGKKKLIEVALPLEAINKASAREKSIRHGHPSTLHLWWARRPLAAARAVIFSQMVDDPSSYPDLFPTEKAQEKERQRLFKIIEELVLWENTTNEEVLQRAREEIWQSWRRECKAQQEAKSEAGSMKHKANGKDTPSAPCSSLHATLFDPNKLPAFHDPFAGGGALPLEAQRLGLEAYASDLNPVAVLINKAMIEIPPKFAGKPPVNPEYRRKYLGLRTQDLARGTQDLEHSRREDGTSLSGTDCMAQGDGLGEGGLSSGSTTAERGDLRNALADHACCGVSSREHSRRMDEGIREGTGAVSGNCAGFIGGDGNLSDAVRGDRLDNGISNCSSQEPHNRSWQDSQYNETEAKRKSLSPESYVLCPELFPRQWKGAQGLAEDVRYYGKWMRDEAEKRIGHLYPKIEITAEMVKERPDLKPLIGKKLTVIAWLWARTVKSPNPAFANVDVPLAATFMLSTKEGKESYVEPVIEGNGYRFAIKVGKPKDAAAATRGTKSGSSGSSFLCLMSGTPMPFDYLRTEAKAGRMSARLMAIVAEGERGRVYLSPTPDMESIALSAKPIEPPDTDLPAKALGFRVQEYGMTKWRHLFTSRQLVALTTFTDLAQEARERVKHDAIRAGLLADDKSLEKGGTGAIAYAEAVAMYLAFAVDKYASYSNSICGWHNGRELIQQVFGRQAIPMMWDYAEVNTFSDSTGNFMAMVDWTWKALETVPASAFGYAQQADAQSQTHSIYKVVSTDPPYYDNIGYADLSDFFYVWMRRALRQVFPELFATLAVPKAEELVATPYRHGSKAKAEAFFLDGMTQAMHRLAEQTHPAFPVTIYYAFKQAESDGAEGTTNTGWDTFLAAVIETGFAITGTWPMRTEMRARALERSGTNALASSIVLVCRQRPTNAPTTTRREFLNQLKAELPVALAHLQKGNIAPVDLAQAAIGPGMAVYTRYAKVLDAEGKSLSVREALALINQEVDEFLTKQEGDFDADSRWAITWFEEHGFAGGEFGRADDLSRARNTSVAGLAEAGIVASKAGKVRLLKPSELPSDWDPATDTRLTVWEMVHHLIRVLEAGGEGAAAELVTKLGSKAEIARELAYRLYTICERKKRAQEALSYNALVQSWPEIVKFAGQAKEPEEQELRFS